MPTEYFGDKLVKINIGKFQIVFTVLAFFLSIAESTKSHHYFSKRIPT